MCISVCVCVCQLDVSVSVDRIYCDGVEDVEFCEFIDKQEDAIEELDRF